MNFTEAQYAECRRLLKLGKGARTIASELGLSYHHGRSLVDSYKARESTGPRALDPSEPLFRLALLKHLQAPHTIDRLAKKLHTDAATLISAIHDLEQSGYLITRRGNTFALSRDIEPGGSVICLDHHLSSSHKFGFITDTHLCNRNARLDVLETAYNLFAKEGITKVFHAGNLVDGECRFNKHELLAHGIADQCQYALDHYPSRSGMTTYFLDADDHEGWWRQREGIMFGRLLHLEAEDRGRKDLQWQGYMEFDVELRSKKGSAVMKVMHPGGGSAYAYSYTSQKLVESFGPAEKPAILLCGHYHKMDHCYPRSVHVYQGGTTCDQTWFMRKNKIAAHVGFWIIEVTQDATGGISRVTDSFFPFYDRPYYAKALSLN